MIISTRTWTIVFIVVVIIAVLGFLLYLYGGTNNRALTREEIIELTKADNIPVKVTPEERARVVRSTMAVIATSTMPSAEKEKIIRATTAVPKPTPTNK